jgi:hypothetical protein
MTKRILRLIAAAICSALLLGTATAAPIKIEGGLLEEVVEDGLTVHIRI